MRVFERPRFDFGAQVNSIAMHNVDDIDDPQLVGALFRDYSLVAAAYTLEPAHICMLVNGVYGEGRGTLPANIAVPLTKLAAKLNIHPVSNNAIEQFILLMECTCIIQCSLNIYNIYNIISNLIYMYTHKHTIIHVF